MVEDILISEAAALLPLLVAGMLSTPYALLLFSSSRTGRLYSGIVNFWTFWAAKPHLVSSIL
jgi:hypothetical protein